VPISKRPVHSLDDINQRRRDRETLNQVLDHSFDDSRRVTDIEAENGIPVINAAYPPGDVRRYGMVPDWNGITGGSATGTDNAVAHRRCLDFIAAGGSHLDYGNGRYLHLLGGTDADLSDLQDLDGVTFYMDGAHLYFKGTYSGSQTTGVYQFWNSKNFTLVGSATFQSDLEPSGQAADRGLEVFLFHEGCENIDTGQTEFIGCRSTITWLRGTTSDPKGKNGRHQMKCTDVGYGINNILNGDNITASIQTLRAIRSYYPYGIKTHRINLVSQDSIGNADANISSAGGEGCDDIILNYTNTSSTVADNSIVCVKVSFTDQTPAVHRNIRVNLNISAATASDYLGYAVMVEKLDNTEAHDTVDRGHILDGLDISGQFIAKNGTHRSLNICGNGTWGAGEYVRNVRIHDLRMDGGGQPIINLASLKDTAIIDNVYCSALMQITGNSVGKILCVGVDAPDLTTSAADTSAVDYIGCNITGGSNQSTLNKLFVNTNGTAQGSVLQPSQITSYQNNYNPSGIDRATVLLVTTDAARTITGIAAPRYERELKIVNTGNFNLLLAHNSGSSSAGNRIIVPTGASYTMNGDEGVHLAYGAGAWRIVAGTGT
jgi:hypothetical protein